LPDGLFSNRPIFGKIWWALEWKMLLYFWPFVIFDGHFGIIYGRLVYAVVFGNFFPFWYVSPRKIWQPCSGLRRTRFMLSHRGKLLRLSRHRKLILTLSSIQNYVTEKNRTAEQLLDMETVQGQMLWFFKYFRRKIRRKKLAFLTETKLF
jgi:hypothetical protein